MCHSNFARFLFRFFQNHMKYLPNSSSYAFPLYYYSDVILLLIYTLLQKFQAFIHFYYLKIIIVSHVQPIKQKTRQMREKFVIVQKNLFARKGCQVVWKIIAQSPVTFPRYLVSSIRTFFLLSPVRSSIFISSREIFEQSHISSLMITHA